MEPEGGVYCEHVLRDDVAVAYLRGALPEEERDAFERHYFECAACHERLRIVRDAGVVLRSGAAAVEAWPPRPARGAFRPPARPWLAWAAGAAFVAVGAAVVLRNLAPPAPPSATPAAVSPTAPASAAPPSAEPVPRPPLDVLARVEPPPYAPLVVRGGEPADAAFAKAMDLYVRGDHAGAAAGLRAALQEDPSLLEARFYLGVSELLAGRAQPAVRELRRVASGDDEGFAEAARYYLAKAHLSSGDAAAARRELQLVARGEGDHKQRAEQLLEALGAEP
jgi:TolA-binding protein